ncbi:nitric oxide synthase [Paenibacillaceae bacterium]|nr:nitric oxide synthase [Paenibacillaceae bacterium]
MTERTGLLQEAEQFIKSCYQELGKSNDETASRLKEVNQAIACNGTYEHTLEELQHGAKMAWRNSNRCIGRLFWDTLHVMDARDADTEEAIAAKLIEHIEFATNGGKIRPVVTVFRAANAPNRTIRLGNHQLIRYAGYETGGGPVGDPASLAFTRLCSALGWRGEGGAFDVLPLVIRIGDNAPVWFDIPQRSILEVPIEHPEMTAFVRLNLRWYAVPMVSDMHLEIGGIQYMAAPFNGWYMGTEIGARNFADEDRYNMLPEVAALMGLDQSKASSLWKDKALVELNVAVLHSFKQHGVTIVDHHTAAQQFKRFERNEANTGREVTGDWSWLIPPVSPAATGIFHKSYINRVERPNFFYRDKGEFEQGLH